VATILCKRNNCPSVQKHKLHDWDPLSRGLYCCRAWGQRRICNRGQPLCCIGAKTNGHYIGTTYWNILPFLVDFITSPIAVRYAIESLYLSIRLLEIPMTKLYNWGECDIFSAISPPNDHGIGKQRFVFAFHIPAQAPIGYPPISGLFYCIWCWHSSVSIALYGF